jgi:hypothetical protein
VWVDDQGVCHTVALPDPTKLMSLAFRRSLDQLLARGQEAVATAIEAEEILFYEEWERSPSQEFNEAKFVSVAPPVALMIGPVGTITELRGLLCEVNLRWRLDALAALDDYL